MPRHKTIKKPCLATLIAAGQRKKEAHLVRMGCCFYDVTQADIDYWLIFITNLYGGRPQRIKLYLHSYNVYGKISEFKRTGQWPPAPHKNKNMLPLFKMAYRDKWPY